MDESRPAFSKAPLDAQFEVRELGELLELAECESIQRTVWGLTETELVPVGQLKAAQHAGGLVAGASLGGELVGFTYGFPAYRPELVTPHGLHSHMTAVLAKARSLGVGRSLKWFQRRWCLERGLTWVEWTFDPLRAANAKLNLEYLGAQVREYLPDAYGPMEDALNFGLPSDRLVARWQLEAPELDALERGEQRSTPAGKAVPVLQPTEGGLPGDPVLEIDEPMLAVEVPIDLGLLLSERPETALAWRFAVRRSLTHYLEAGYLITRFVHGSYVLQRPNAGR
jgi:chorismate synthase